MGVFSISSHQHGIEQQQHASDASPSTFNPPLHPHELLQKPDRKISVPISFYSQQQSQPQQTPSNLEEAEAASDRKSLFSSVKFSLSKSPHHHHTVSPIKVQVSPAEPTRTSATSIPSTVRITRRHTEHAGTIRKFTSPLQMPPAFPSVSNYPEPIVMSRPHHAITEESMEEMEGGDAAASPAPAGGAGVPSLPVSSYRFKLPPLQVSNATLMSTNRVPDFNGPSSPPPKMMTSVGEPVKNKSASFASESPSRVSRYRVFFKCFFVVLFFSIPVVIFVVMMALSGGFAPFPGTPANNKTAAFIPSTTPSPGIEGSTVSITTNPLLVS